MGGGKSNKGTINLRTVEERMRFILDDTISFFNSSNRCYLKYDGTCLYHNPVTGNESAIGRWFPSDGKFDVLREENIWIQALIKKHKLLWDEIKIFRGINNNFLTSLQNLHDCAGFWDKNGLSEAGAGKVYMMKEKYLW